MSWSERQRAMLREMGIPAFWPVPPEAPAEALPETGGAQASDSARPIALQGASSAEPSHDAGRPGHGPVSA
ncbi:MAG: uracil-DNA glycosylase, partial [Rubrivivax sp.]